VPAAQVAPLLPVHWRSGTSARRRRKLLALLRSVASAICTSPLVGVVFVLCVSFVLRRMPFSSAFSDIFCSFPLSPVLPTRRFGVGLSPGDSRPGSGRLCSIRPPPTGHSGLDVDANYTVLTPRPRFSPPSCAHLIASLNITRLLCAGALGFFRLKAGNHQEPEGSSTVIPALPGMTLSPPF
jgi:hypothetical protein